MGDFRFGQKWKWLGIAGFFLLLVNLLFFGHHLSERDFGTIRSVSRNYMQLLDENQGKNYRELFEKLQDEEIAYSTPEDYKKLRNMDVTSTEALLLYRENLDYLIHFREQYASVAALGVGAASVSASAVTTVPQTALTGGSGGEISIVSTGVINSSV